MTEQAPGGGPPPPGWQPPANPPPSYAPPSYAHPAYGSPPYGPPSYVPPAYPPASYPVPAPGPTWTPAPGMLGAAHKPGAMPLRPLGLGDMYDAAFRIIRFNPRATVGSAVLVAAVSMAIPVLVTAILTASVNLTFDPNDSSSDGSAIAGLVGSASSLGLGSVLYGFGNLYVTAMIAHVTAAAAVGRRLSLGEAWAATRGRRWRLLGLSLLLALALSVLLVGYVVAWVGVVLATHGVLPLVVFGLVSFPVLIVVVVWFWVRVYYLSVPALMLERTTIWGALRRAYALTRKQFWRTFGIALLTVLVTQVASSFLSFPIGLVGQLLAVAAGSQYALLVLVVTQALAQVLAAAFVTPFTSAVTSLQYLDQRMRKEAYDVELMQQAGLTLT